jgi:hypothetical protein
MAGGGVGALVEALHIFLDLLDRLAILRETGVSLVEQEKVIVPLAERFLGGFIAGGEGGDGFGGIDAGLCEIACGLGCFAKSVKILIVPRVEAADVFGEPALGDGDELCTAEVEVEDGAQTYFEGGESHFNSVLLTSEALDKFALGFLSKCGEIFAEALGVRSAIVGG